MIFKLIVLGIICWFLIDTLNTIIDREPPDNPEDENLPYQLIDEIAKERERVAREKAKEKDKSENISKVLYPEDSP